MELLIRARAGDLDEVKSLIQQGAVVHRMNCCNETALHLACRNGHTEVAKYLLDNGASVNHGEKPLIAAVKYYHYDCVKLLLEYHADVNCTNTRGESPMSVALQEHPDDIKLILLLLQYGAVLSESLGDDISVQLLKNATVPHAKAIQKLIDENVIDLKSHSTFRAAFHFVFKQGSVELAERMLLNNNYSKIRKLCPEAVYYSTKNNWPNVLLTLFEKGVNINVVTSSGATPLYIACNLQHANIVSLLLHKGADPNIPNDFSETRFVFPFPLQIAVLRGNETVVKLLLEKGAKIDQSADPLLPIACSDADRWGSINEAGKPRTHEQEHTLSIVKLLLQHGDNVNALSREGDIALYRACESQQLEVVQFLLEAGADVNLTSGNRYPLMAACNTGNVELINLLVSAGADVKCKTSNNRTRLHAVANSSCRTIGADDWKTAVNEMLLNAGADVNAKNNDGQTALCVVCLQQQADASVVEMLLKFGADPNITFSVRVDFGPTSADIEHSPLSCACMNGNKAIVESLLMNGAAVAFRPTNGFTPLHYAVNRLNIREQPNLEEEDPIVALLLKHNAPVNVVVSSGGKTPLYMACEKGLVGVVKQLLEHNADVGLTTNEAKKYPLMIACKRKFTDIAMMLLDRGANVNVSDYKQSPLKLAAANGDPVLVKRLLDCGANVNHMRNFTDTALHVAVLPHRDHCSNVAFINIVHMLLKGGAKPDARNHIGETPLYLACRPTNCNVCRPDVDIVQILLEHGADPNICPSTTSSSWLHGCVLPPLSIAAICGNSGLATLLIKYGARVDDRDDCGRTALHFAVDYDDTRRLDLQRNESVKRCISIAEALVSAGADINALDRHGSSPLHLACDTDKSEIVDLLLENKADVNIVNSSGETPLFRAASRNLLDVVNKMLEACGGNPNKGSAVKCPLVEACVMQNVDIVDSLLKHGADPNLTSTNNPCSIRKRRIPLFLAVAEGNSDIVASLLNAGADVNAVNDEGKSIVCFAAESIINPRYHQSTNATREILNSVLLLLQRGANVNKRMADGRPPIYLAVSSLTLAEEQGCPDHYITCVIELLQLLVKYGSVLQDSSVRVEDFYNKVLYHLASFDGSHKFVVDLFRAGAGFQLLACCCNGVVTTDREVNSISLCKAAVLAGFVPSDEELQQLELIEDRDDVEDHLIQQLVNWLNEDRQQVPSLLRQCRVVIRRQLSVAVHFQSILPAIEQLGLELPYVMQEYLQFDGPMTEVDLSVKTEVNENQNSVTTEEISSTTEESSPEDNDD